MFAIKHGAPSHPMLQRLYELMGTNDALEALYRAYNRYHQPPVDESDAAVRRRFRKDDLKHLQQTAEIPPYAIRVVELGMKHPA